MSDKSLMNLDSKKIFLASQPVDFRMSIDGLSEMIKNNQDTHLYDGSIYVFYNKHRNKIKCLYWDMNGFVLFYKRLDRERFKFRDSKDKVQHLTHEDLHKILMGISPEKTTEKTPKLRLTK